MRKLLLGIAVVIFAIIVYIVIDLKPEGTVNEEDIVFSIAEPAQVDHVSMKNRSGQQIDLKKDKNGIWMVNSVYPAFEPFIDIFLNNTLAKVKIKGPAPTAARDNIIRDMVTSAIKVDIYSKKKLIRSYYVGGPSPDLKGTYVHLEGSKSPYLAYIPGFDGYITPKYNMVEDEWYSRSIFDFEQEEIASIKMKNFQQPNKSYELTRDNENFTITPAVPNFSQQAAKSYFALFKFKNFEGYPDYLNSAAQDSIKRSSPLMTLTVTTEKGEQQVLHIFRKAKQGANQLVDNSGQLITYDPERYFASFTGFDRLVTIQEYTFGQIMAEPSEFID